MEGIKWFRGPVFGTNEGPYVLDPSGFIKDSTSSLIQRSTDKKGGATRSILVALCLMCPVPCYCYSGIISSVGQSEVSKGGRREMGLVIDLFLSLLQIWVKRLPDNSKLRIYVTQLVRGKYVLKRRSA